MTRDDHYTGPLPRTFALAPEQQAARVRDERDQYKLQLDQARTQTAALASLRQLAHGQWSALATLPRELRDALGLDPGQIRVEARMRGWRPTILVELIVDEDDTQPAPGPIECGRCVESTHGDRVDIHTLDQQPCVHTGGL